MYDVDYSSEQKVADGNGVDSEKQNIPNINQAKCSFIENALIFPFQIWISIVRKRKQLSLFKERKNIHKEIIVKNLKFESKCKIKMINHQR